MVRRHQPELYDARSAWFAEPAWREEERAEQVTTHAHGHGERRPLQRRPSPLLGALWPGARQARQRTAQRTRCPTGQGQQPVTYALTSLAADQVSAAPLEALWRGHWTIETRDHRVRDGTWQEDAGHAHLGATPQALAAWRHGLTALLRARGWTNLAEALRHYGASVLSALRLLGPLP